MPHPVPAAVRWSYLGFLAVLAPVYLRTYGPMNFLFFCDVALILTAASVVTGRALPASMAAVGILLPQLLWLGDFAAGFLTTPPLGIAAYMFDAGIPLSARALSLFHGWLPLLLLYLLRTLGYDRRALPRWTLAAWLLIAVCYLATPPPPAPADDPNRPTNVNYVFGIGARAQTWMPPAAWAGLVALGLPLLVFWPTHAVLARAFPPPSQASAPSLR